MKILIEIDTDKEYAREGAVTIDGATHTCHLPQFGTISMLTTTGKISLARYLKQVRGIDFSLDLPPEELK